MNRFFGVQDRKEEIRVSTDYDIGGMNFLSGESSRRGYYAYVQPVVREDVYRGDEFLGKTVQATLFDGFKVLLIEVKRKGKEKAAQAEDVAELEAYGWAQKLADQKGWTLTGTCVDE